MPLETACTPTNRTRKFSYTSLWKVCTTTVSYAQSVDDTPTIRVLGAVSQTRAKITPSALFGV